MLRSLHIKNFRLFRDLKIEHLNRVNLIAGKNNTGKTALLEALYLLFADFIGYNFFSSAFRNSLQKSLDYPNDQERCDIFSDFWIWLPNQRNGKSAVKIMATEDSGQIYCVEGTVKKNGQNTTLFFKFRKNNDKSPQSEANQGEAKNIIETKVPPRDILADSGGTLNVHVSNDWPQAVVFSTRQSSPFRDADIFNKLVIKKKRNKLIELLRIVEPQLADLQYSKIASEPLVYADLGLNELIPITQLGQCFTRLFRFFCEMLLAESRIVLIDEVENGLHYSLLEDVWKGIAEVAEKEDLQIFATTHSWECIQAASKVFKERGSDDFALHRLQRVHGEIQAIAHDLQMIEVASETDLEIR